jgi:hypothetical protein
MIPYPDLVAALEQWRLRNGLPVGGGVTLASMPAPAPAPSFRPSAPPAPAPTPAPSSFGKVPARPQTDEPLDLGDADVLDDEMLSPEGGDFAMPFGVSSKPAPAYDDDGPEEKTAIGVADEGPHTSPFATEGAGPDTYDAEADVLDESDDPDPRHSR